MDDDPVERMKGFIWWLNGKERLNKGEPCGRSLRCPMPKCEGWPTLKIDLGTKRPDALIVCCTRRRHNKYALARAVTKACGGLSLTPRWRPASPEEMRHAVEKMCHTTKYDGLSPRAKALAELLVDAVLVNGEPNGGISRTGTELMAALGINSWRWLYEAIDAVVEAGIVIRGSRGLSHGYKSGPSNLWGLACLPVDPNGRSEKRAEAAPKPRWTSSRKRPKPQRTRGQCAGRTWRENVQKEGERAAQPIDIAASNSKSYACVSENPPKPAPADPAREPRRVGDLLIPRRRARQDG